MPGGDKPKQDDDLKRSEALAELSRKIEKFRGDIERPYQRYHPLALQKQPPILIEIIHVVGVFLPFVMIWILMAPLMMLKRNSQMEGYSEAAVTTLTFFAIQVLMDCFAAFVLRCLQVGMLRQIYKSDTSPTEAMLLLLEWDRNMAHQTNMSFARYAAVIRVINKARSNGYQNPGITYCGDHGDIAEQLHTLLLSKAPRSVENPHDDIGFDYEEAEQWEYDHNEWVYKSLWPARDHYTASFRLLIFVDLLLFNAAAISADHLFFRLMYLWVGVVLVAICWDCKDDDFAVLFVEVMCFNALWYFLKLCLRCAWFGEDGLRHRWLLLERNTNTDKSMHRRQP